MLNYFCGDGHGSIFCLVDNCASVLLIALWLRKPSGDGGGDGS